MLTVLHSIRASKLQTSIVRSSSVDAATRRIVTWTSNQHQKQRKTDRSRPQTAILVI